MTAKPKLPLSTDGQAMDGAARERVNELERRVERLEAEIIRILNLVGGDHPRPAFRR